MIPAGTDTLYQRQIYNAIFADSYKMSILQPHFQLRQGASASKDTVPVIKKGPLVHAVNIDDGLQRYIINRPINFPWQCHGVLPNIVYKASDAGIHLRAIEDNLRFPNGPILIDGQLQFIVPLSSLLD